MCRVCLQFAIACILLLLLAACGTSSWEVGEAEIVEIEPLPPLPTLYLTPTRTPTPAPPTPSRAAPSVTPRPSATPLESVQIVVAVRDIPFNAPIPPDAVELVDWPVDALPRNTIGDLDDVIGQVSVVPIGCNEPVLWTLIGWREVGSGFDPIPPCPPATVSTTNAALVDVVVTTRRITPGEIIPPNAVALRPWPASLLPPDAHTSLAAVIGKRAAFEIRRSQPVLAGKLR